MSHMLKSMIRTTTGSIIKVRNSVQRYQILEVNIIVTTVDAIVTSLYLLESRNLLKNQVLNMFFLKVRLYCVQQLLLVYSEIYGVFFRTNHGKRRKENHFL